ncbi:MAG: hypothetical protein WDM87_15745 [Terracidiphilus sp.]
MKEAIAEYEALGEDKLADLGIADNLAFALFYGGEYAEAYKAGQTLNPETEAAAVSQHGNDREQQGGPGRGEQAVERRRVF